jgi:hypothetical protein
MDVVVAQVHIPGEKTGVGWSIVVGAHQAHQIRVAVEGLVHPLHGVRVRDAVRVYEEDDVALGVFDAEIAPPCGTGALLEPHDPCTEGLGNVAATVRGACVDHDDRCPVRRIDGGLDHPREEAGGVVGRNHNRDEGSFDRHRCSPRPRTARIRVYGAVTNE